MLTDLCVSGTMVDLIQMEMGCEAELPSDYELVGKKTSGNGVVGRVGGMANLRAHKRKDERRKTIVEE